jgi:transposase
MDGWKSLPRLENDHDRIVPAEYGVIPTVCVRCGVSEPRLKKHGILEQLFMDTPAQGKRVGIKVRRQRFQCCECRKTFFQPLPDMDEKRQMTRRLLDYIQRRSLERTFTEVASDVGVNEKTVRNIFKEYVTGLNAKYWPLTPSYLGIDEVFLVRKPRCVFTSLDNNTIMDLLPNRDKASVLAWLKQRQLRELVEVVTMDMWRPYRDAALEAMPNAKVVIDRFHVVKLANLALDTVRKSFREGLDLKGRRKLLRSRHLILKRRRDLKPDEFRAMEEWTNSVPILFAAYQAKEDFFDLYECKSRADALEYFDAWKACLGLAEPAFRSLAQTVENWKPEIFNFFDYREGNAYTEASNGITKVANRMGRGYSFEAIRAKILFGQARHIKKPKFGETELTATGDAGVSVPHLVELVSDDH